MEKKKQSLNYEFESFQGRQQGFQSRQTSENPCVLAISKFLEGTK